MKYATCLLPLLLLSFCVGGVFAQNAPKSPPPSPLQQAATKVLREMPVKLHEGRASDADVQACVKLIELAPNDNARRPFIVFIAQYQRIMLSKPERAILTIAPYLLDKEKVKAWQKTNDEAVKAAKTQWLKDDASAKKAKKESPKLPSAYLVDLPPLKEWTINESTALFAVEAAYCLAALDKPQRAVEIIDAIGQKYEDETRVLAAECGADLFIRTKMYQRAVEFYGFALGVLETLKKQEYTPGKGERVFFTEEQQILRNRLAEKLGIAQKLYDEDRFGPDWVAYRDAQHLHFGGRYLEAYFAYMEIVEKYRDSVYGEAAMCYLIEILCKLADKENIKNAAETFKQKRKELETAKLAVMVGERFRDPEDLMQPRRENAARLEKSISLWKSIPLGENAIVAAEKYSEQFIERDKYGLYRGEAMLAVGLCWLETYLDPEKAEPWLKLANGWFDEVKKTDSALTGLEVPDRSKQVSQPPKEERTTDMWTNVRFSKPKAGDLFNRRTCKWYLSSKHKNAVLWLGMIAYANKDYDVAKVWWEKLYQIDPYFKEADQGMWWSTAKRLIWDTENTPGCFFATHDEMKAFKDVRSRFALLMADFELEQQNYPEAEKKFRRLLDDKTFCTSREQAAYCTFALATALKMQFKSDEAVKLFVKFGPDGPFCTTPTAPRALIQLAHHLSQSPQREIEYQRGMKMYVYIVENFPKSEFADQSQFSIAFSHYAIEQYALTEQVLKAYLKKFPKGKFTEAAKEMLEEVSGAFPKNNDRFIKSQTY